MAGRREQCPSQAVGALGLVELLKYAPHTHKALDLGSGLLRSARGVSSVPSTPRPSQGLAVSEALKSRVSEIPGTETSQQLQSDENLHGAEWGDLTDPSGFPLATLGVVMS